LRKQPTKLLASSFAFIETSNSQAHAGNQSSVLQSYY